MRSGRPWRWIALAALLAMVSCCSVAMVIAVLAGQREQDATTADQAADQRIRSGFTADPIATDVGAAPVNDSGAASAPGAVEAFEADAAPERDIDPPPALATVEPDGVAVTEVPAAAPATDGGDSTLDVQALRAYAEAVKPLLDQGLEAAERDGEILKGAEDDPDALCGGGSAPHPVLAADAALMSDLVARLAAIEPPAAAADTVHHPLSESARLWGEALDTLIRSCGEDPLARGLSRLGAVVLIGEAMLNFRIASDNFWRLVLESGLEAVVGPRP